MAATMQQRRDAAGRTTVELDARVIAKLEFPSARGGEEEESTTYAERALKRNPALITQHTWKF
jgi:hypothetical protein